MGTTSLVLGALSIPLLLCFFAGPLVGVAAIVTGSLALRSNAKDGRGRAITGIALGVVAIATAVALVARPDS
jgi:uncharacterized membrane protein HdeD (DUF308 family)